MVVNNAVGTRFVHGLGIALLTAQSDQATVSDDVQHAERVRKRMDLASATLMAVATIATAWCGYQSTRWGGEQTKHNLNATVAIVRVSKFANLAEQRIALHTTMFGQWAAAVSTNNTALANFLFDRLPEPLKAATVAWRATSPLTNPHAPATPFDTPKYVLPETAQVSRWEETAVAESAAADSANGFSDRYLIFTIIFASVLFFAGISGKFDWYPIDLSVLVLGALTLAAGLVIMLALPLA